MEKGLVRIFYGSGKGKSSAAVGQCIRAASVGRSVIIIQFLKGKDADEFSYLNGLEPEIKFFRFEKENERYDQLLESQKKEEKQNIINGYNFARKCVFSGESDVIVLDEVLGLVDLGIISIDDIKQLLNMNHSGMDIVLTGQHMPDELYDHADVISKIELIKDDTGTGKDHR
ncbi:MAG: cob(I)yrinic acid a,c-diamide adenosyltransferase [Lachnospiraceae bacterium]|jgi:cob(I)alamin adenosyltransferase|nr:cob(I)yrinic acid a,c-diamide adenosyltransferase [Lachnospiraceae bacterium]MEE3461265.1 cob(I)yrinic acid a,c-diamide adenosyltransferase [Lachnospiraceae bacterium]